MQFGRVIDATLMIDKDTGRPRGFGFVTFDSEAAVEAALSRPLDILGKPIEVKKAQPRGNLRDEEDRRNRRKDFREPSQAGMDGSQQAGVGGGAQGQMGMGAGLTPQMMAQYWQRMQQYFTMMQQQMAVAASQGQGGMNPAAAAGGMGMNPAMMQQMQMKQMQQMQQQMGNAQAGAPQGSMSPPSQSPTPQMQNMMNPAMMQQMQQMQQQAGNNGAGSGDGTPNSNAGGTRAGSAGGGGPGYNAHEQIAFEQQKYEQQQARRVMDNRGFSPYQQGGPGGGPGGPGGPTSWEGMYDEVPQPNMPPTGPQGMARSGSMGRGMPCLAPPPRPSPHCPFYLNNNPS